MDSADRALLNEIQKQFPIDVHPYKVLGQIVGTTEEDAFLRIQKLRREGIIRRLGGVFDSRKLGYFSTLCTAKVPEEKIPALAKLINKIPGITHNYVRNHDYNVWFTLIARSEEAAEQIIHKIRKDLDISEVYNLPATHLFKINVNFDFSDEEDTQEEPLISAENGDQAVTHSGSRQPYDLTHDDVALIQIIQGDLPDSSTPFTVLAERLNWTVEKLISRAKSLLEAKVLRRFGAVLRHQKAGFVANSMGVWQVEPARAEEVGKIMAQFKEVSHCYERPTLPDWPYNVFTMIHGKTIEDCDEVMKRISQATGVTEYSMLFSTAELKKSSMQYFLEEESF
ncbi:DNA-binding transcriptional regulator AsnC [Desulfosporosinus acididurans]|uniref:siroheme decarboxylase n=1 Tax=Desulfosporosinus acididurans TaxID=476652 RepID=A0A0J1FV47_9FIRM|nr:Lrp/AsnC family transcriptional regulator [Desulfosporosinus acididurans]KLU66863.1 DNA-binding transcriptional regulator AsnC [Desulfosporosinus acididurans]